MSTIKKHIHGVAGAFVFLVCISVFLILAGFTTPLPLPQEQAILLDLSNYDIPIEESSSSQSGEKSLNDGGSTENILNQDFENSEFVESGNSDSKTDESNLDRINDLFKNPFGVNDKGDDKDGKNPYDGDGKNPDNISGNLTGRKQIVKVNPESMDNSFGRVVLQITVNESGNVTDIILVSTTCNECVKPAKDAVKKWKYETLTGSGLQSGTVVIEFKQN